VAWILGQRCVFQVRNDDKKGDETLTEKETTVCILAPEFLCTRDIADLSRPIRANVIPDRSAHPTEALNPSILTTLSKFEAIANSQNLY
jgi:hypothetical protein